jgi:hypothetical protein
LITPVSESRAKPRAAKFRHASLAEARRVGQKHSLTLVPDRSRCMHPIRWLALLPFIGILVGAPFLNRVTPLVFGLPLLLAWLLLWIVLTSVIMLIIYRCDPANRPQPPATGPRP